MENITDKRNLKTRLSDVLVVPEVQNFVYEYYRKAGKEKYPGTALPRWKKGTHYPPVDVLVGIAKTLNTNVSWVLGLTDVKASLEYDQPCHEYTLTELLDLREMSDKDIIKGFNNNYKIVNSFSEKLPLKRVSSLIKLSQVLDMSVDFILGYTMWETWEFYDHLSEPFKGIVPGSGIFILADKSVRCMHDIEDAIKRGDGKYALFSTDGISVILPNGKKIMINDPGFKGVYVAIVAPVIGK